MTGGNADGPNDSRTAGEVPVPGAEPVPHELGVAVEFAIQDAWRLCESITRREARNFYHGLRLLPRRERLALYVVYAWMRVVDDIADDGTATEDERRRLLDWFEARTRAAFGREWHRDAARVIAEGGESGLSREELVCLALAQERVAFSLGIDDFLHAIEGQRMDLAPRVYADFAETALYCDRVASTVGRICLDVWGVRDGADGGIARELSTKRGVAFQLVNILRDVREDRARGRCYLPADELAANGLDVDGLIAWRDAARCARFMHVQAARAERIFAESAVLDGMVSADAVPTIGAMSAIYRGILRKIARDPRRALVERARLSTLEKSWIALRARFGLLGARA
jgi:phytoene synthase